MPHITQLYRENEARRREEEARQKLEAKAVKKAEKEKAALMRWWFEPMQNQLIDYLINWFIDWSSDMKEICKAKICMDVSQQQLLFLDLIAHSHIV